LQTTILKKKSASTFLESAIINNNIFLSLLLTFKKAKVDKITLSETDLMFIIENKMVLHKKFQKIDAVSYNGLKEQLLITTNNEVFTHSLKAFRISYDEGKVLKTKLKEFNSKIKTSLP
tara:strand:+ start:46995 stop:47351 length:357 start_codon:yes stop_codon:yes gene_type:complete